MQTEFPNLLKRVRISTCILLLYNKEELKEEKCIDFNALNGAQV